VSEATRSVMLSKWHPRQVVTVIPNGVDRLQPLAAAEEETGDRLPGTGIRVLSLSRLSAEKRIPELLEAFSKLRAADPDATLTVAGEGPLKEELQALARRLGVADAVTFPGFVDPVPAMASADVLVQLSVWENCSYTLLDAVNAGLGVVATPVGGNPEILPDWCLVDAEDESAVAAAIQRQAAPGERPALPQEWPDVAAMTGRIAGCYQDLAR
jgi:glycogen(starch) synthase